MFSSLSLQTDKITLDSGSSREQWRSEGYQSKNPYTTHCDTGKIWVLFQRILGYPPSLAYVVVRDPKWCHLSQSGVQDNTASKTLSPKTAQAVCHHSIITNIAPEDNTPYLLIFLIYWRNSTTFNTFLKMWSLTHPLKLKNIWEKRYQSILALCTSKIMSVPSRHTFGKRKIRFNCFQGCIIISFTMFKTFPVLP